MQTIQVPGIGSLNFPDEMSQPEMAAAIQKNFPEIHQQAPPREAPAQHSPIVPGESISTVTGKPVQTGEMLDSSAPYSPPAEMQQQQQQEGPGFLDRVGARAEKVGAYIGRQEDVPSAIFHTPQILGVAAGQIAGVGVDVAGEAIKGAYRATTSEDTRRIISESLDAVGKTRPGQAALGAIGVVGEKYAKFAEAYPDAALALEGLGNLTMVKAMAPVKTVTPARVAREYAKTVKEGINKSIRPGVEGKRTFGQVQKFYKNAEEAVTTIIKNKTNLRLTNEYGDVITDALPANLHQFSQAVDQSKHAIFKQYDVMAKQAGAAGARVELAPAIKEMNQIVTNKAIMDNAPNVVEYAAARAESLANRVAYTAEEAQEAISILNRSLESFYKNPSYEAASRAYVDSVVVGQIRSSLDAVIEATTSPGYQALKRQYGSLKSIERDVNRRMVVDSRKAGKGLIDFTDVVTGERAVTGILTMNPVVVGQAASIKLVAGLIKRINDPNRVVKNMFTKADKLLNTP
jgi:hypothetical protein